MGDVTLEFISKQLERVLVEQAGIRGELAGIRDEMLVFGARMDRVEAGIHVLQLEFRAVFNQISRTNDRLSRLEGA